MACAYSIGRKSFPLLIVLFLLWFPSTLFAGGRKEDSLSKVDTLIAERRYNEAIIALTSFIKEDPKRFDDAQKRLQRIIRLRDEYNALAGELLDVMVNDPTNDEYKLAMIRRLEELEAAPNRAAREFITKTKNTSLFTYNRAQFERIMADGRAYIDAGDIVLATQRYSEGFVLYRDEFFQAGYGDLVQSRVERGLQNIESDLQRFETLMNRVQEAAITLQETASRGEGMEGYFTLLATMDRAEPVLLEFAALRNRIISVGRSFENQFLLLQGADEELGDNSFLPFAYRFILGRKTEIQLEGITGALDTFWSGELNGIQTALSGAADKAYEGAHKKASEGSAELARSDFQAASGYADLACRAIALWSAPAVTELSPAMTPYGKSIIAGKAPQFLEYQILALGAQYAAEALNQALSIDTVMEEYQISLGEGESEALALEQEVRSTYQEINRRSQEEIRNIDRAEERVDHFIAMWLVDKGATSYLTQAKELYRENSRMAVQGELQAAVVRYKAANQGLELTLEAAKAEYDRGEALLMGTERESSGAVSFTAYYPRESIPIFAALKEELDGYIQDAKALVAAYGDETDYVLSDSEIEALAKEAKFLSSQGITLLDSATEAAALAQDRVDLAESLRLEAQNRYREAQRALDGLDFDRARERAQLAGERYDASLAVQEAPELRAERDQLLLALSVEISKLENEVVVRDVRSLINQAKTAYFASEFDRAEEALVSAQNRWRTTNVEDESEVSYWLTLVRSALALQTGRTISVTAPLYAEISQLLSGARTAFEEGHKLLRAGNKVDALIKFDEARKKIEEVHLVFPLNQEASLLSLRIDQLIDPDAFGETFRRRFIQAQASLSTSPQDAFSDLQDLSAIDPNYPGIQAAIEKAEIQLGLRLPPPDPRALARSNELMVAARRIMDSNIRSQFPVALEQLNEALKLNPDNEEAISLKDKLQTEVGGQALVVLSSAAEREYQRAVQELQRGNTIVALSIVEQLLQNEQNRNSSRILELQRRIQARL